MPTTALAQPLAVISHASSRGNHYPEAGMYYLHLRFSTSPAKANPLFISAM